MRLRQCELSILEDHIVIGRRQVDGVPLGLDLAIDFDHWQFGLARQQGQHEAFVSGRHVLRHDVACANVPWQRVQQLADRLQPAGGCGDADDEMRVLACRS